MSEPKESDIAFAKKIAPDLARGMQTYDEYIAKGEELGVLARAYKRKWDDLLAGIAAYREEIEASLAPAPAQSREEEAQIIEEYADYLYTLAGASVSSETDAKRKRFQSALAALRSRQSPQTVAIDDIFRIDAVVEASEESAAKCSWRRIKGAIVAPRPSAAPQPSPQGKDAERDIVGRLLAACNGHPYAKIAWPHRLLHDAVAEIKHLRSRLASVQSSAQGEEARGMREELPLAMLSEIAQAANDGTGRYRVVQWEDFDRITAPYGYGLSKPDARAALERKETK